MVANQDEIFKLIFPSEEKYQKFRLDYMHKMAPLLEKDRVNRMRSYDSARRELF